LEYMLIECDWNRDSERQIVLEIQRVSSSRGHFIDVQSVALGSSHGQCVDERPRRQPFTSIGNLSHVTRQQQQQRLNVLNAVSGTHRTGCIASPAGALRRAATVNLHTANTSTPILVSPRFPSKHLIKLIKRLGQTFI